MATALTAKEREKILDCACATAAEIYAMDPEEAMHGKPHWLAVAQVAAALATKEKANPKVAEVFGLVHDCCRDGDGEDLAHGPRAADLVRTDPLFRKILSAKEVNLVATACEMHPTPERHEDPNIGVCLDGDRLTIGRCKSTVKEQFLSTRSASQLLRGAANHHQHGGPSVFYAHHGSHTLPQGVAPRARAGQFVYTALDEESASFYGPIQGFMVSCSRLADLTDPMRHLHTKLFDQLKAIDKEMKMVDPTSGDPMSVFDAMETGDFYRVEGRRGQENFIWKVMALGYDAVLLNDHTHSTHPSLVLSRNASILKFVPERDLGWQPAQKSPTFEVFRASDKPASVSADAMARHQSR